MIKSAAILGLTLMWVQMGMRELWENQAFVDDYCDGQYSNKFIQGYCIVHAAAADYSSINNLLYTFCFASTTSIVTTSFLLAYFNARMMLPIKRI